jgi:hypothetical protein
MPDKAGSLLFLWVSQNLLLPLHISQLQTGLCIGVNAAVISITTEWLSDIKMGYCSDGWWLNQQFCCWEIEGEDTDACDSWHSWSNVWLARWFIYIVFAVPSNFRFIASLYFSRGLKYRSCSPLRLPILCDLWQNMPHHLAFRRSNVFWLASL